MGARRAGGRARRGVTGIVTLSGAESTGKSTLGPRLAARFGGAYLPEYGRTYAETHGPEMTPAALRAIAAGHIAARDAALAGGPRLLIEDTDIVVTCAWAEMLFGVPDPALEGIASVSSRHLLLAADVPLVADPVRVFVTPAERARFDAAIRDAFARRGIVPVEVGGDWTARAATAAAAVAALLRRTEATAGRDAAD